MPPRQSARLGAQRARLDEQRAAAAVALQTCMPADAALACRFAALPLAVVLLIFALLPADMRAQAARVCRCWRWQLTAGPDAWRLWTDLDLSETTITRASWKRRFFRFDRALAGATANARGRLQTLTLVAKPEYQGPGHAFTHASVVRVLRTNPQLTTLTMSGDGQEFFATREQLDALLAAGPQLQQLYIYLTWNADDVATTRRVLRREREYAAVRPLYLELETGMNPWFLQTASGLRSLAADLEVCTSLQALALNMAQLGNQASLAALVSAVRTNQLKQLILEDCGFADDGLAQLARLLECPDLQELKIWRTELLADHPLHVTLFCDALQLNTSLHKLELDVSSYASKILLDAALRTALENRPADAPACAMRVRVYNENLPSGSHE